jgi:integrase
MPRPTLTKEAAASAKGEAVRYELRDKKVPGLRLVVQSSGFRTWVVRYRTAKGQARRDTIGAYSDALGLDEARRLAADKRLAVVKGLDPAAAKAAARVAGTSLQAVFADYDTLHLKKSGKVGKAAGDKTRSFFDRLVLKKHGKGEIAGFTKRDALAIIDALADQPSAQNKARSRLQHFFKWAAARDLIETNPVATIEKPAEETSRARVLKPFELRRIWQACDKLESEHSAFGAMVKVLILTLARRSEAANMEWSELGDTLWTLPEARSKNGIALDVHRTDAFNAVLAKAIRTDDCKYVFEGRHHGKPMSGFSDLKAALDESIGSDMDHWTLHDLRRTSATMMQGLGVRPEVVNACQNHKLPGISAVYLRHGYAAEKVQAFTTLAAEVLRVVGDAPVIALQAAE